MLYIQNMQLKLYINVVALEVCTVSILKFGKKLA